MHRGRHGRFSEYYINVLDLADPRNPDFGCKIKRVYEEFLNGIDGIRSGG